jgi:hypothetical protein
MKEEERAKLVSERLSSVNKTVTPRFNTDFVLFVFNVNV